MFDSRQTLTCRDRTCRSPGRDGAGAGLGEQSGPGCQAGEQGSSAHQRVGADGVGVAAPVVPIVAFINIRANLRAAREKPSPRGLSLPAALPHSCPRKAALLRQAQHPPPVPAAQQPRAPTAIPWHRIHLLAGPRVVRPHAGDGVAPIAAGTGLAAEAGGRVDALGAGEARVGMSALRHEERDRLHPRARHPARWGVHCPRASRQSSSPA